MHRILSQRLCSLAWARWARSTSLSRLGEARLPSGRRRRTRTRKGCPQAGPARAAVRAVAEVRARCAFHSNASNVGNDRLRCRFRRRPPPAKQPRRVGNGAAPSLTARETSDWRRRLVKSELPGADASHARTNLVALTP